VVAGEATLTGEAIKTTFGGSVLALNTPVGGTVSVRIGHDGLMSGEAGTALGAVLGAAKDRGRWWVVEDKVCFKWFRWFDAAPRCATISLEGKHFTWRRDDGDTGTGTIVERGKPIAKPPVIVTEAPAAPPHKSAEKMHEVVVAANAPEAERLPKAEAKPPVSHSKQLAATAAAPQRADDKIAADLPVPAPRPVVRPEHNQHDPILVASVRPQFFMAVKADGTVKAQQAKIETARAQAPKAHVSKVEAPKASHNPFRVAGVDPSDVLNIRTGPSPEYQTVGGIPPDSHGITITGPCQNDWCPVKHRTLIGWVNRRYLTEETAANTAEASESNYWDPAR
jgi:hypothetical protein